MSIVGGGASVSTAGSTTTVTQTTDRAVLNWNSFSINAGETTNFVQPYSTSAVLNRVTGGSLSTIAGTLNANGQVFLVNPAGITFSPTGVVITKGFVASTRSLDGVSTPNSPSDPVAAFMGGNASSIWRFSGTGTAPVVNYGYIHSLVGDVALIGSTVENRGIIMAPNGTVGMATGNVVYYSQATPFSAGSAYQQRHIAVLTGSTPVGSNAAVLNAQGASISALNAELEAASGNPYALAINNGGTIRATSVSSSNGHVYLNGGGSKITNTGAVVAASSLDAAQTPATIQVFSIGGSYGGGGSLNATGGVSVNTASTYSDGVSVSGVTFSMGGSTGSNTGGTLVFDAGSTLTSGTIISGAATFGFSGSSGVVLSISPSAVIDWSSFSIAATSSVHIVQLNVAGQSVTPGQVFSSGGSLYLLTAGGTVVPYSPLTAPTASGVPTLALYNSTVAGSITLSRGTTPSQPGGSGTAVMNPTGATLSPGTTLTLSPQAVAAEGTLVTVSPNVGLVATPAPAPGAALVGAGGALASASSFSLPAGSGQ